MEVLEEAYNASQFEIALTIGNKKYAIDFDSMTQKNLTTSKVRGVKRRPAISLDQNSDERRFDRNLIPEFSSIEAPKLFKCKTGFNEQILASKSGFDYDLLHSVLIKQFPTAYDVQITRIENFELWAHYCLKRGKMRRRYVDTKNNGEKLLFHGTSIDAASKIPWENFDWRLAGTHVGQKFGAGVYFTPNIVAASHYAAKGNSPKCIMVSLVLTGEFTMGNGSLKRPPPKPSKPEELYDSCVNDLFQPSMNVIFDHNQMYPLYKRDIPRHSVQKLQNLVHKSCRAALKHIYGVLFN